MLKRSLFTCAVLGIATSAFAGAMVDLRPDVAGPYVPGQVVNVDVWLVDTGDPVGNVQFRGLFLDFADTGAGLAPAANFTWENPFGIGAVFPALPNTSWVYPLATPNPLFQITLPEGGEVRLGDIDVTTNATDTLDVMNADNADPNFGARADFGFGGAGDPVTTWRAFSGELTGGTLEMVVPEPGTLALLGLGAAAALRRRRNA